MDIRPLVHQVIAETLYKPDGFVTTTVWRNEVEVSVTAPYWIVSRGASMQRDPSGQPIQPAEGPELELGVATDESGVSVELSPEEEAGLYEKAQLETIG